MNIATKWEDVSLKQYEALMEFINSNAKMTDLDRSIEICALLSDDPDKTRDTLLSMGLDELAVELNKVQFIINKYKAKAPETEYTIAGDKYTVQLNIRQMTAAQYIDDPRLSNVWGKEIYRITLKAEEKKMTGNYKFVIQQVK